MFELINSIEVDRKNSLPVADFIARYRQTSTPVVLGDLTKHWQASKKWSREYLATKAGSLEVPIYSSSVSQHHGGPYQPVLRSSLKMYLEKMESRKTDFRISKLPLKLVPSLQNDFLYPRLGFDFNLNRSSLSFGGSGVIEPAVQSSSVVHTVRCNFGDRVTVLLIPPDQSQFMYRVGYSRNSVRDINFDQPQLDQFPALRKLFGYVAELNYGDALYIPAGFWCCASYQGVGITLSLEAYKGSFRQYASTTSKLIYNRLASSMPLKQARFRRLERRAVLKTNAQLSDR